MTAIPCRAAGCELPARPRQRTCSNHAFLDLAGPRRVSTVWATKNSKLARRRQSRWLGKSAARTPPRRGR